MNIYLAAPYSHPDSAVREERAVAATLAAAYLMSEGHTVFSPLSHGHAISATGQVGTDHETWRGLNDALLQWCEAVYLLQLPGWEASLGVGHELAAAEALGKSVVRCGLQEVGA